MCKSNKCDNNPIFIKYIVYSYIKYVCTYLGALRYVEDKKFCFAILIYDDKQILRNPIVGA